MTQRDDIVREAWQRLAARYPSLVTLGFMPEWSLIAAEIAEMLLEERRKARER